MFRVGPAPQPFGENSSLISNPQFFKKGPSGNRIIQGSNGIASTSKHVLLNHNPAIKPVLADGLQDAGKIHDTFSQRSKYSPSNGSVKVEALLAGFFQAFLVNVFQVQTAEAIQVASQHRDWVPAAENTVPG